VSFNVPLSTAQDFYYSLSKIGNIAGKPAGTVDLVTTLKFNEINNQFITTNEGGSFVPGPFFVANPDNAMSPAVFGSQPVKLANPPFCLTAAAASAACFSAALTSANVNASCKEGLDSI
jgi:hypothetical protein